MKIKELEEKTGIGRAAIRFYEKQGLISPDRNKENEYREYSNEDESRLRKIIILRKLGFSVSEIQALFEGSADLETQLVRQIVMFCTVIDKSHNQFHQTTLAVTVHSYNGSYIHL